MKVLVTVATCVCIAAGCSPDDDEVEDDGRADDPIVSEGEGEGEGLGGTPTYHPLQESRWQHEVDGVVVDDLLGTGPHQPIGAGLIDGVATILSVMVVDDAWSGSLQLLQDPLGAATTIEVPGVIPTELQVLQARAVFADADGDGDTDIVLALMSRPLHVLENTNDGFVVVVGNGVAATGAFVVVDTDDDEEGPEIVAANEIVRLRAGRLTSTPIATVFEDGLGYCLSGFAKVLRAPQTVFAVGAVCVGNDVEDLGREDRVFALDATLTPTASLPAGMDLTTILARDGTGEVVVVNADPQRPKSLVVRSDLVGSTSYAVAILTAADLDGDGVDSFVAAPRPGDVSPSDTHFIERTRTTLGPFVVDLDGDGREDLLLANEQQ